MTGVVVESDIDILDYLRTAGPATVSQLARHFSVTPTAVRQRLGRLVAEGLVDRFVQREGRGRPRHVYRITGKGRLRIGSNYADLACALWHAIRKIPDDATQKRIITLVAEELTRMYLPQMSGLTVSERMGDVVRILGQRRLPFLIEGETVHATACNNEAGGTNLRDRPPGEAVSPANPEDASEPGHLARKKAPSLVAAACPYPDLAEIDPSICEFERLWLSELLGAPVHLAECRRNGGHRCRFEVVCGDA
ncbi:MAG: MarR family transcriptional regulator [Thermogutta sp.]|uniref:helix-turn-helix transcriptional regulator n=1 Tax=Thermogutta sp. TaxID=1962930 RepID=UPI0019A4551A|nr:MarR family transcriptional regulator [Thermogutta sp.]MBC7353584.1 MarR family transcriptional regulator [Thermogutta sp.]